MVKVVGNSMAGMKKGQVMIFAIAGILFLLCSACVREEAKELRGVELCRMAGAVDQCDMRRADSLVRLSEGLSAAERYVVLLRALKRTYERMPEERLAGYLRQMDSLKFPKIKDKATALMLLEGYDNLGGLIQFGPAGYGRSFRDLAPWVYDPGWVSRLLFDLEHRWKLEPQERLFFLVRKAFVYSVVFGEKKSTQLILKDAFGLVREHGGDPETIHLLLKALNRGFMGTNEEEKFALIEELTGVAGLLENDYKIIYLQLGLWRRDKGDYPGAYKWLSRLGMREVYFRFSVPVYIGLDSLQTALDILDESRRTIPQQLIYQHAGINWYEALVRQRMGDSEGYERCLQESLEVSDLYPDNKEVDHCGVSEAYARLLWQQGKRAEAIRRMEFAVKKLMLGREKGYYPMKKTGVDENTKAMELWLSRFRLLRDYYNQVGRTEDALRQSLLCDTLEAEVLETRLLKERQRSVTTTYMTELTRQLELRAAEFQQEQLRARLSYAGLGLAVLGLVLLWVLYRRRQRQLNVLYARQKEVEQLEADKRQMAAATRGERLSPEEQLFRELERQFYEEELFRNPGFSRDDLCRLGGSNRMYVSTCINKYAGTNINQWINKARIDHAIRLIGEGEDDLTKLSELSGFSSLKSFFRSFRQFTELSPRQYIVRERQPGKE